MKFEELNENELFRIKGGKIIRCFIKLAGG